MKRFILILLITILLTITIFGEGTKSSGKKEILKEIGFRLGGLVSNQEVEYPDGGTREFSEKGGSDIAIYFKIYQNELFPAFYFNFQPELRVTEKGMEERDSWKEGWTTHIDYYTNTISYLSFNATMKFSVEGKRFIPYLIFSPRFDFLMNSDFSSDEQFYDDADDEQFGLILKEAYDNLEKNIIGYDFGGGFDLIVGKNRNIKLIAEYRMMHDLGPAADDIIKLTNSGYSLTFGLGYIF